MASANSKAIQTLANEIVAAMKSLTDSNNRSYVNNEIKNYRMTSSNVGKDLYASFANIAAAQISVAEIDTAQIRDLEATTIETINLAAERAVAGDLDVARLRASIAAISDVEIRSADIDYAHIKDLDAETAIFTDGVGGKLYIDRLVVSNLQVVEQTVGSLIIKSRDGRYYRLDVDIDDGSVVPVDVTSEITPSEIVAGVTSDGKRSIIETDLTVDDLYASNIKAINALIDKITAGRIDVGTLFANRAFAGRLYTNVIESPSIVLGYDSPYNIVEATWSDTPPSSPNIGDGWVNTSVDPNTYNVYKEVSFYYERSSGILYCDKLSNRDHSIALDDMGILRSNGIEIQIDQDGHASSGNDWVEIGELTSVKSAINLSDRRISFVVEGDGISSEIALTNEMLSAIANKVNLMADTIDLSANHTMTFNTDQLNAIARDINLSSNHTITFNTSQLQAIANDINLSANHTMTFNSAQLSQIATDINLSANHTITFNAQQLEAIADNINLESNESIRLNATLLQQIANQIEIKADQINVTGQDIDLSAANSITLSAGQQKSIGSSINISENGSITLIAEAVDAAQSTADVAQNTADNAQSTADSAQARFERVMKLDESGLHIGDNQSGGEVLIDSESVNVVLNGQRYSKFAGNYVQFGNYQIRRSIDGGLVFKIGG